VGPALVSDVSISGPGEAIHVAQAALFLANDAARYVTREIMDVNGGAYFDQRSPRAVACLLKVIGPDRSIIARQKFGGFSRGCDVCLSGLLAAREASRFVMATGDSLRTRDGEMEKGRATLDPVARPQPRTSRSARRSRATTATSCARTPPPPRPSAGSPTPAAMRSAQL
jgi:hypothetical protein